MGHILKIRKGMMGLVFLPLFASASLCASNVATQTITFCIQPISEISISGDPPTFTASQATAGSGPVDVEDMSTFYSVTTNGTSEKVVACLNSAMPTGTSLLLGVEAPTTATSVGEITLDISNQNVVTGITQVAQSNLVLCYDFVCTVDAGVLSNTSRIVTLTLCP